MQNPTFADLDRDGDLDFIIGSGERYPYPPKNLRYFENIGTPTLAVWREDSSVVAPIAQALSAKGLDAWWAPEFVDANGDKWPDLLLAVRSIDFVSLSLLTSHPEGQKLQWQAFGAPLSKIRFPLDWIREIRTVDMDDDGLKDLMIDGRRIYPNEGTPAEARFSGQFLQFGGVPATSPPLVFDYKKDGTPELVMGDSYFHLYSSLTVEMFVCT